MGNTDVRKCAVIETLRLISAKWKPCILCQLMESTKRYGKLLRIIPNISRKMLTQHLRELERDGLITRRVFASVPPRVEYAMTDKGKSLWPVFQTLEFWGLANLEEVNSIEEMLSS